VRVQGPQALGALLRDKFGAIPGLSSTRTTVVLETQKETTQLPLPSPSRDTRALRQRKV